MWTPCLRVVRRKRGNDVEVVWAKSARGVWGLGHVFDGKLYFTRDICEEKWIPKDLVPPKKSVAAPKARGKVAPQPRGKPAGLAVQAGAKAAAKPAPRAIASSSSASSLCLRQWRVPQFALRYPCNLPPPPPGHRHLVTVSPPTRETVARYPGTLQGGGRVETEENVCFKLSAQAGVFSAMYPNNGTWKAKWREVIFSTRAPGGSLRDKIFFFVKDPLEGPPQETTNRQPPTPINRQPPPTANHQPPPTAANRQRRPTANCQPLPTATNHRSPTTNRRQPPPTATNRQLPTANLQPPPTANRQPPTATNHARAHGVPAGFFGKTGFGTLFFSPLRTPLTRAQKKSPLSPRANLGGFGLLRNAAKHMFEIMGQAGVFPAMYPNSAKMALGWPSGREWFFRHVRAARHAKKVSVVARSELGWIQLA